jgi:polyphosphate kinase 2
MKKRKKNELYEKELYKLQVELNYLQRWVKQTGQKAIILFEGRDSAGKGGAIKRITERVSPRVFRTVALPVPTEREKTQMYAQRWIQHFPAAGEIVLFDRSWYSRAGVEHVMGFCTPEEYRRFLDTVSLFEKSIIDNDIILIKLWFEIDQKTQTKRFLARINDPRKQWKLSPMDLESHRRWHDYSRARDEMFKASHTKHAPWHIIDSNDKKSARLNAISFILSQFPYEHIEFNKPTLKKRKGKKGYKELDWSELYIPETYRFDK